jgi:hypothetical protein
MRSHERSKNSASFQQLLNDVSYRFFSPRDITPAPTTTTEPSPMLKNVKEQMTEIK